MFCDGMGSHIMVLCLPHDNFVRAHLLLPRLMRTFWPIKSVPWYKLCSPMVMVSPKTTKPLFTQLTMFRIGFLSRRIICRISPWPPQLPDLNIIKFCGQHWSEQCVLVIHCQHSYLNLPPFCRKNGTIFPWQTYRNCIYLFG